MFLVGWACYHVLRQNSRKQRLAKLPPGPYPFPIVGNILQLGLNPPQSLAKLSKIYGPIMYLKLGSISTIVVSSPEMAKEVLQKHDHVLSGRRTLAAAQVYDFGNKSMAFLPVDTRWRHLRKMSKEQMFSLHTLESSQEIRQNSIQKLYDYIHKCSIDHQIVDIGEVAFITAHHLISATICSIDLPLFNSNSIQELRESIQGMTKVVSTPNLVDYFPVLKGIDPQGIMKESKSYFGKVYSILQDMINERLKLRGLKNDILESLLDYSQSNPSELPSDDVKHFLLDLFAGGLHTVSSTVEWAITELIRNPEKMLKARNELWDVVGGNEQAKESDISRLPYLQSVVKETFRYHPVGPFLIPHKAEADVEINGYVVPKNAQILVNIWAIGRDSSIWLNPDSFEPERFLNCKTDIKGQDFELIPFGSGRRMCPAC
ncbi:Cytochrome [Abeliophyllum distichum]|uniref:Cytochrome n=1 Tax=Abeliophyllum distichum TaxID=126358 RepID=A0ABD1Q840_9LAMI